jgi:hypothetical protein
MRDSVRVNISDLELISTTIFGHFVFSSGGHLRNPKQVLAQFQLKTKSTVSQPLVHNESTAGAWMWVNFSILAAYCGGNVARQHEPLLTGDLSPQPVIEKR